MNLREVVKRALPAPVLDMLRACKYGLTRPKSFRAYREALRGKSGIEIGGPSIFFQHLLPVYPVVSNLDGVNFSSQTMWEGVIRSGDSFRYAPGRTGRQFIAEATDLGEIEAGQYQFLLSSNCLEHVANPLKAIEEWIRVIEPGGYLVLVLPNKAANFDHRRPFTRFEHLLDDYRNNVSEKDMTHLQEILELHDLTRDAAAGGRENFVKRSMANYENRGLHHHVFNMELIERMLAHFGVSVVVKDVLDTDFVVLGRTPGRHKYLDPKS